MKFDPNKIKKLRRKRNLSGEALCILIANQGQRISRQSLSHYEIGKYVPDANIVAGIAMALGEPVSYFFTSKHK